VRRRERSTFGQIFRGASEWHGFSRHGWMIARDHWEVYRLVVSWHRPPQHFHYRGAPSLAMLVQRVRSGLTTERDAWRVLELMSKLDRAEGALHGTQAAIEVWRTERDFWREQAERNLWEVQAWRRWEHAWVFGGDVPYPGRPGVTDPRETLDALERLALGVEEGDDGHLRQRLYEANHLITEAYVSLEILEPNHPLVDKLEAWPGGEGADDGDQT